MKDVMTGHEIIAQSSDKILKDIFCPGYSGLNDLFEGADCGDGSKCEECMATAHNSTYRRVGGNWKLEEHKNAV